MKNSTGKKRLFALSFALLILASCFVGVTFSKYVTEEDAPWDGDIGLDFTVNSVFVVSSQDELFEAINQGYTFIQLDKEIDNPLIVTQKAETLNRDLILDLNGIEIQRNGQEPILNIKPGVRLTVVDTSTEQTGGLYNPVGSVFNINGGTLTVVTGSFESGPRYSEYYSYNTNVLKNDGYTRRTLVESEAQQVKLRTKTGENIFSSATVVNGPIIKSYPQRTGEITYNYGNLYFDEKVEKGDITLLPDTYCYYRTSESVVSGSTDLSMADWYYTYFVNKSDYSYAFAGIENLPAGESASNYVEVTIYGYEDVIQRASQKDVQASYYAAIQMTGGTLDVQDGDFYQYFGLKNTACVNCSGGEISVKQGSFSSRVPDATSFSANTVVEKESPKNAFVEGANYFSNFSWFTTSGEYSVTDSAGEQHNGRLAKNGESYCILNSGNAQVNVTTGDLYSSNNNIISMEGGQLAVTGGSFTKRLTNGLVSDATRRQLSAISVAAGSLQIANAACNVIGNNSCGIIMAKGMLDVDTTEFSVNGDNAQGIHSLIKDTEGTFTVTDSPFAVNGANAKGITAENGSVTVTSTVKNSSTISVEGANSVGIQVTEDGSVVSNGYKYVINGKNAIGIDGTNTALGITVDGGSFTVHGDNAFGIRSKVTEDDFHVKDLDVTMSTGNYQTGIYAENGSVDVTSTVANGSTISVEGTQSIGIHVNGNGSVISKGYKYLINGTDAIGIYGTDTALGIDVDGGSFTVKGNNAFGIRSLVTEQDFHVKDLDVTMSNGTNQTGIYAEKGRVDVTSTTANASTISVEGANSIGIHVNGNGSVVSNGYKYVINGQGANGIYGTDTASGINVDGGSFTVQGNNAFGICSFVVGNKFFVKNLPITMTNGTNQTGIYAENGRVEVESTGATALISIDGDSGIGIHVGSGGSVVSTNYSYKLHGKKSYGILSEAGTVLLTGGEVELTSGDECYGISAVSESQLTIVAQNVDISVGVDDTTNKTGTTTNASVGVFLSSTDTASNVNLNNVNISSLEVGVALNGGSLALSGTGSLTTKNASAIAIRGGDLAFEPSSNYQITSRAAADVSTITDSNPYNITLPVYQDGVIVDTLYRNTDGIYVNGGSFQSDGNLKVMHTGLKNDTLDGTTYTYSSLVVQSYAVRVLGGNLTINKGEITALVGGGIYSGSTVVGGTTQTGNIFLGSTTTAQDDIVVETKGNLAGAIYNSIGTAITEGWQSRKSITGGHAIELDGGNITVYNGKYTAEYGNGVMANGSGRIEIYDGLFKGNMNASGYEKDMQGKSGPAAFYGLKVVGGATVIIRGGIFDGGNGGAFVTGVTQVNNRQITESSTAHVLIYKGEFGHEGGQNSGGCTDAFNVYDDAEVVFGAGGANYFGAGATADTYKNAIKMYCWNASIAANSIVYSTTSRVNSNIYVYYGTYSAQFYRDPNLKNGSSYTTRFYVYNSGASVGYTSITGTVIDDITNDNNRATYNNISY